MDQEGFAAAADSVDQGRIAARRGAIPSGRPCPNPDPTEPVGAGTIRGAQQRPHLSREGAGVAELSALPAPGSLGCPAGRRQGPRKSLLAAGRNGASSRLLRRAVAVRTMGSKERAVGLI